ncbi:MAG TPA: hypothetical protein VE690_12170 [Rhodopila sp.]|nr:hypothetical protein [Rhodopila sp.]
MSLPAPPGRVGVVAAQASAKSRAKPQATLRTLDKAGRRYRVDYTSATLAGTHVPVLAGLAVTVSPITTLLPEVGILLLKGRKPTQPLTDVLAAHIADRTPSTAEPWPEAA